MNYGEALPTTITGRAFLRAMVPIGPTSRVLVRDKNQGSEGDLRSLRQVRTLRSGYRSIPHAGVLPKVLFLKSARLPLLSRAGNDGPSAEVPPKVEPAA